MTELNHAQAFSESCANCHEPTSTEAKKHPDHRHLLNRLRRTEGQVRGIINMVETDRYCVDILVQTRALAAAIRAVESEILNKHVKHCVQDAVQSKNPAEVEGKLQELLSLMQRLGQ